MSTEEVRIIPIDERVNSVEDVRKILSQISFAPSCVDMGWEWQAEPVFTIARNGAANFVGYRLRTTFRRPDRDSGLVTKGFGRWWEIPADATVSAVVKTAFAAAKMILEHELMEAFKWKDQRCFDPHNSVAELASLNPARYVRGIP